MALAGDPGPCVQKAVSSAPIASRSGFVIAAARVDGPSSCKNDAASGMLAGMRGDHWRP